VTPLLVICAALGAYRLAFLVAYEDGPADAATHLRTFVARRWGGTWLHRGVQCPLCVSFWTALLLVALVASGNWWMQGIVVWLGVAGAALVLHHWVSKES
jgi:hypothetical protein